MAPEGKLKAPLPIQPLQAHLWHFAACTQWYIKGTYHLPLALQFYENKPQGHIPPLKKHVSTTKLI